MIKREPPIAHVLDRWDEATNTLYYEYNGRPIISVKVPEEMNIGFRHRSDGNMQTSPFLQQIFISLEGKYKCETDVIIRFKLSHETVNMRSSRAKSEQAILGQIGKPLIYGVNGLYDLSQDLLIDWNGCPWNWNDIRIMEDEVGDSVASITVKLSSKPLYINLRMQYYRKHLNYKFYKPWDRMPNKKPVSGWCSWEAFRRDVNQKDIDDVSEFFNKHLKAYGLEYIQLDDGYERLPIPPSPAGNISDSWVNTNKQFPDGHTGIVNSITKNGFKAGIWTNCVVTNKEFAYKKAHYFLKDKDGSPFLGEWINYVISSTSEMLAEQIAPYYKEFKEKGYEYLKIDAIRHLIYDGYQEAVAKGLMTNDEAEQAIRNYMECVRKALGDDVYLLSSWGVLSEVIGIADACRIATDANPSWGAIRMQIVESARWFHSQRILFLNDPDHICARAYIEWVKSVTSLVSLSGSLYMLSDPIESYTEDRLDLIKHTLPTLDTVTAETGVLEYNSPAFTWTKEHGFAFETGPSQKDRKVILGISDEESLNAAGEYDTMNDNHPFSSLWSFHFDKPFRQWCVVGRFPTTPIPASEVPLQNVGLNPQKQYICFDYWENKVLGIVSNNIPCKAMAPGTCQVIGLTELTDRPQVIASTRHVSMDAISILNQVWQDNRLTLDIASIESTTESYWFHVPSGYELESVDVTDTYSLQKKDNTICITINFKSERCTLKLFFKSKQ